MIEQTLKESLRKRGCPICRTINLEMDSFFRWFSLENYHEHSSLKELYNYSYICERHKNKLMKMTERLNNTFEFMIEKDLDFLSNLENLPPRKFLKELRQTDLSCRFCLEEKKIEEHIVKTLSSKSDLINAYLDSPSVFCKKHLFLVLISTRERSLQIKILNKARVYLENVHNLIENYFKKIDFNSQEKPSSSEREAYRDALGFYASQLD